MPRSSGSFPRPTMYARRCEYCPSSFPPFVAAKVGTQDPLHGLHQALVAPYSSMTTSSRAHRTHTAEDRSRIPLEIEATSCAHRFSLSLAVPQDSPPADRAVLPRGGDTPTAS